MRKPKQILWSKKMTKGKIMLLAMEHCPDINLYTDYNRYAYDSAKFCETLTSCKAELDYYSNELKKPAPADSDAK